MYILSWRKEISLKLQNHNPSICSVCIPVWSWRTKSPLLACLPGAESPWDLAKTLTALEKEILQPNCVAGADSWNPNSVTELERNMSCFHRTEDRFHIPLQAVLVTSSLVFLSFGSVRGLSFLWEILVPRGEKGELLKITNLSFLDPSEEDSIPERIFLSCVLWQTILPLFQPGELKDDDKVSWRNDEAAFAIGNSWLVELFSICPRLANGKSSENKEAWAV